MFITAMGIILVIFTFIPKRQINSISTECLFSPLTTAGKTFSSIVRPNVHSDHHALWINPDLPGHLINGNDGGVNITYDDGKNWMKNNSPTVGQFYAINVDNEKPYNVCGGLQDNGVWKGAHNAQLNERWHSTGHNPWTSIMGGDGMRSANRYPRRQYGVYRFSVRELLPSRFGAQEKYPHSAQARLGESPYRFNWQTPIFTLLAQPRHTLFWRK